MDKDYYAILGIGKYSLQSGIKKAYLDLLQNFKRNHRPGHPPDKKILDVEEAYKVLSSPGSRAQYDLGRINKSKEKAQQDNKDYYEILGVAVGSSTRDITMAYRKLALKCHPDKLVDADEATKEAAKVQWEKMLNAYVVLTGGSSSTSGYKRDAPPSSSSQGPTHDAKQPKKDSSQSSYSQSTPPESGSKHGGGSASGTEGTRETGGTSTGSTGGTESTRGTGSDKRSAPNEGVFESTGKKSQSPGESTGNEDNTPKPVPSQNIFLGLEEIANGCTQTVGISREVVQPDGIIKMEDRIEEINFKPGWKAGTKLIFRKEYYQGTNKATSDIVFVIQEKRHPIFKREGNDVSYTAKVNLKRALLGNTVDVPFFAGRQKSFELHNEIISPTTIKKIPGQGLPTSKEPSKKGDFLVRFEIKFPYALSNETKEILSMVLPA